MEEALQLLQTEFEALAHGQSKNIPIKGVTPMDVALKFVELRIPFSCAIPYAQIGAVTLMKLQVRVP